MPVRPPTDIHLTCTEHPEFESSSWTDAWNHQLDEHTGDQTLNWNLAGTVPPE
jgi:hypothetical protein